MRNLPARNCAVIALPVSKQGSQLLLSLFVLIKATATGFSFRTVAADLTGLSLANLSPQFMADIKRIIRQYTSLIYLRLRHL
jgi:hypothetical protein